MIPFELVGGDDEKSESLFKKIHYVTSFLLQPSWLLRKSKPTFSCLISGDHNLIDLVIFPSKCLGPTA